MFYENLAKTINLPNDFLDELLSMRERLGDLTDLQEKLFSQNYSICELQKELEDQAKQADIHPYTYFFYFLFIATKRLHGLYKACGIEESIFFNSMKDLSYKLKECQAIYQIAGTSIFDWFPGFYRLQRFGLGRLQYDITTYDYQPYEKFNLSIQKGDVAYGLHIPSSGPLTREDCYDSYRQACKFFKTDQLIVVCHSWLFNPHHHDFLPLTSNILTFINDFDLVAYHQQDHFDDAWRIFGNVSFESIEDWPEKTALQHAYKKHILKGGSVGEGQAVLVFDGKEIINKKK